MHYAKHEVRTRLSAGRDGRASSAFRGHSAERLSSRRLAFEFLCSRPKVRHSRTGGQSHSIWGTGRSGFNVLAPRHITDGVEDRASHARSISCPLPIPRVLQPARTAKEIHRAEALSSVDARARAIETLYRERFAGYCSALTTVTGDRESARDAVQEAFARAFRERRRLRREESLAPWVWTIAFRLSRKAVPQSPTDIDELGDPALPDLDRDPELAEAIRALSPRRRMIVFLRYFADFSYAEIAEACAVSEGTVAATLAQAHEALRSALNAASTEGACR